MRADEQKTRVGVRDHVLDELEEGRLGPVDVLEQDDERARRGELLEELASPPVELLHGERLLREPDRGRDAGGHVGVVVERGQLRVRLLRAVALGDPGGLADGLGERPEADAVAVGETAATQNERVCVDGADELVQEP